MRRRYWIALAVAAVAVVAAGSAVAATKLASPGARSQAIISDAAGGTGRILAWGSASAAAVKAGSGRLRFSRRRSSRRSWRDGALVARPMHGIEFE